MQYLKAFELQPERCNKLRGAVAGSQEQQEQRTGNYQTIDDYKEGLFNSLVKSKDVAIAPLKALVPAVPACSLAIFT